MYKPGILTPPKKGLSVCGHVDPMALRARMSRLAAMLIHVVMIFLVAPGTIVTYASSFSNASVPLFHVNYGTEANVTQFALTGADANGGWINTGPAWLPFVGDHAKTGAHCHEQSGFCMRYEFSGSKDEEYGVDPPPDPLMPGLGSNVEVHHFLIHPRYQLMYVFIWASQASMRDDPTLNGIVVKDPVTEETLDFIPMLGLRPVDLYAEMYVRPLLIFDSVSNMTSLLITHLEIPVSPTGVNNTYYLSVIDVTRIGLKYDERFAGRFQLLKGYIPKAMTVTSEEKYDVAVLYPASKSRYSVVLVLTSEDNNYGRDALQVVHADLEAGLSKNFHKNRTLIRLVPAQFIELHGKYTDLHLHIASRSLLLIERNIAVDALSGMVSVYDILPSPKRAWEPHIRVSSAPRSAPSSLLLDADLFGPEVRTPMSPTGVSGRLRGLAYSQELDVLAIALNGGSARYGIVVLSLGGLYHPHGRMTLVNTVRYGGWVFGIRFIGTVLVVAQQHGLEFWGVSSTQLASEPLQSLGTYRMFGYYPRVPIVPLLHQWNEEGMSKVIKFFHVRQSWLWNGSTWQTSHFVLRKGTLWTFLNIRTTRSIGSQLTTKVIIPSSVKISSVLGIRSIKNCDAQVDPKIIAIISFEKNSGARCTLKTASRFMSATHLVTPTSPLKAAISVNDFFPLGFDANSCWNYTRFRIQPDQSLMQPSVLPWVKLHLHTQLVKGWSLSELQNHEKTGPHMSSSDMPLSGAMYYGEGESRRLYMTSYYDGLYIFDFDPTGPSVEPIHVITFPNIPNTHNGFLLSPLVLDIDTVVLRGNSNHFAIIHNLTRPGAHPVVSEVEAGLGIVRSLALLPSTEDAYSERHLYVCTHLTLRIYNVTSPGQHAFLGHLTSEQGYSGNLGICHGIQVATEPSNPMSPQSESTATPRRDHRYLLGWDKRNLDVYNVTVAEEPHGIGSIDIKEVAAAHFGSQRTADWRLAYTTSLIPIRNLCTDRQIGVLVAFNIQVLSVLVTLPEGRGGILNASIIDVLEPAAMGGVPPTNAKYQATSDGGLEIAMVDSAIAGNPIALFEVTTDGMFVSNIKGRAGYHIIPLPYIGARGSHTVSVTSNELLVIDLYLGSGGAMVTKSAWDFGGTPHSYTERKYAATNTITSIPVPLVIPKISDQGHDWRSVRAMNIQVEPIPRIMFRPPDLSLNPANSISLDFNIPTIFQGTSQMSLLSIQTQSLTTSGTGIRRDDTLERVQTFVQPVLKPNVVTTRANVTRTESKSYPYRYMQFSPLLNMIAIHGGLYLDLYQLGEYDPHSIPLSSTTAMVGSVYTGCSQRHSEPEFVVLASGAAIVIVGCGRSLDGRQGVHFYDITTPGEIVLLAVWQPSRLGSSSWGGRAPKATIRSQGGQGATLYVWANFLSGTDLQAAEARYVRDGNGTSTLSVREATVRGDERGGHRAMHSLNPGRYLHHLSRHDLLVVCEPGCQVITIFDVSIPGKFVQMGSIAQPAVDHRKLAQRQWFPFICVDPDESLLYLTSSRALHVYSISSLGIASKISDVPIPGMTRGATTMSVIGRRVVISMDGDPIRHCILTCDRTGTCEVLACINTPGTGDAVALMIGNTVYTPTVGIHDEGIAAYVINDWTLDITHNSPIYNGNYLTKLTYSTLGGQLVSTSFQIRLEGPPIGQALRPFTAHVNTPFTFILPQDTFTDPNSDPLVLQLSSNTTTSLPSWLVFSSSGLLSGRAPRNAAGWHHFVVSATDPSGGRASLPLNLLVNLVPQLSASIPQILAEESSVQRALLPYPLFTDVEDDRAGKGLTYSLETQAGLASPTWISLDTSMDGRVTLIVDRTDPIANAGTSGQTVFLLSCIDSNGGVSSTPLTVRINASPAVGPGSRVWTTRAIVDVDTLYEVTIPLDLFVDGDEDVVSIAIVGSDTGSSLPSWLTFDTATRRLHGTPLLSHVGEYNLHVKGTDRWGSSAVKPLSIIVEVFPKVATWYKTVSIPLPLGQSFVYQIPITAFIASSVTQKLAISLSASTPLPDWMLFDRQQRIFSGLAPSASLPNTSHTFVIATDPHSPPSPSMVQISLVLVATDQFGAEAQASLKFVFSVFPKRQPSVISAHSNATASKNGLSIHESLRVFAGVGRVFSYTIPQSLFVNFYPETPLSFTLVNVTKIMYGPHSTGNNNNVTTVSLSPPAPKAKIIPIDINDPNVWLRYDQEVGQVRGTPTSLDQGLYTMSISAINAYGGALGFTIELWVVYFPETTNNVLQSNMDVVAHRPFGYMIPANAFSDKDNATLIVSIVLPPEAMSWMHFNPENQTLYGMANMTHLGSYDISIIGDDMQGTPATFLATLRVRRNVPPKLVQPLSPHVSVVRKEDRFNIPITNFIDEDGDPLTFRAMSTGAGPLPAFLVFDPNTRTFTANPSKSDTNTFFDRDYDITVNASDGLDYITTNFKYSVRGESYLETVLKFSGIAVSILTTLYTAYRQRSLGWNWWWGKKHYWKGTKEVKAGYFFSYQLAEFAPTRFRKLEVQFLDEDYGIRWGPGPASPLDVDRNIGLCHHRKMLVIDHPDLFYNPNKQTIDGTPTTVGLYVLLVRLKDGYIHTGLAVNVVACIDDGDADNEGIKVIDHCLEGDGESDAHSTKDVRIDMAASPDNTGTIPLPMESSNSEYTDDETFVSAATTSDHQTGQTYRTLPPLVLKPDAPKCAMPTSEREADNGTVVAEKDF